MFEDSVEGGLQTAGQTDEHQYERNGDSESRKKSKDDATRHQDERLGGVSTNSSHNSVDEIDRSGCPLGIIEGIGGHRCQPNGATVDQTG
jgi:hypothetical protein